MMWVLLIALWFTDSRGGSSQSAAEFNTKDACMSAAAAMRKQLTKYETYDGHVSMVCAYKGATK